MPAQDDDVCLAIVSRSAAEDALGRTVGTVEAQATDPTAQLTCTYPIESGGWLLLTMSAADVENEYETDLVVATSHDQVPLLLDGIGDRAFYGSATSSAPEQVVFTKGPVIVRLWNQTDAAVGQAAFADLAGSAADAIEAEVRP